MGQSDRNGKIFKVYQRKEPGCPYLIIYIFITYYLGVPKCTRIPCTDIKIILSKAESVTVV